MPVNKKTKMPKTPEKRPAESVRDYKNGPRSVGGSKSATGAAAQPAPAHDQLEVFQAAIRQFHAGKFQDARQLFQQATGGANRAIAHKAELHIRMCNRRLEEGAPELKTPEDHYNYAIALINSRELEKARHHLDAALALDPQADHVYYAAALCHGLAGNLQAAYENLKRAIDLQPRNRVAARQDTDFAGFVDKPPLDRLLFPERKPA